MSAVANMKTTSKAAAIKGKGVEGRETGKEGEGKGPEILPVWSDDCTMRGGTFWRNDKELEEGEVGRYG